MPTNPGRPSPFGSTKHLLLLALMGIVVMLGVLLFFSGLIAEKKNTEGIPHDRRTSSPFGTESILLLWSSILEKIGMGKITISISMDGGWDLTASELSSLIEKAAKGDGDAAWRLYLCCALARHDEKAADVWLCRAAELQITEAQRVLAHAMKEGKHPPGKFGATGSEAFYNLLESASRTNGQACHELASAYAEGYLGASGDIPARFYFTRGANLGNRMCWKDLSSYCQQGRGGSRDLVSAYYWISLETRCVHPASISGGECWKEREEIAGQMSAQDLLHEWEKIDAYIEQVRAGKAIVSSAPFGKGLYQPDESEEGIRLADEAEADHRRRMMQR